METQLTSFRAGPANQEANRLLQESEHVVPTLTREEFEARMNALEKKEIFHIEMEFIERYCERNSEADRCDQYKALIEESLQVQTNVNAQGNGEIVEIDLEVVEQASTIDVQQNPQLSTFNANNVQSVENNINVNNVPNLDTLSLNNLQNVGGGMSVRDASIQALKNLCTMSNHP